MRALVVKDRWLDLENVGDTVTGTVNIVDSIGPLTPRELVENVEKHCIQSTELEAFQKNYRKAYAWVLADAVRLKDSIPYEHRRGAVIWVKIPDIVC